MVITDILKFEEKDIYKLFVMKEKLTPLSIFQQSEGVTHKTKKDIVAEKIIEMITTGLIQDKDELPSERELTKLFEVSRETIRGALNKVAAYGLINISQGSKTTVNASESTIKNFQKFHSHQLIDDINQYKFEDVFQARLAIEIAVVKEAAQRITKKEIEQLKKLIEAQKNMLTDPLRFQMSDQYFHKLLAQSCRNDLLLKYSTDLYNYGLLTRREFLSTEGAIEGSVKEHIFIVDMLSLKDPEKAAQALEKHLRTIFETTKQQLRKHKSIRRF
ncbi:GntR family transcriptional regulator [Pelistega indica]|uniref:GntR family transcriptional regulator n=1 Tax=Pelistega indica TaxID=1414851 RepID=V8G8H1_9BURK|nr:FadR/GntR family transcriptional regulator [Pelistega indica]ETD72715.1 GntR family transcriptional regulator [Pelistega indica]